MDEEDPVCPIPAIAEACKPKCKSFLEKYNACAERIEKKGEGDCEPWYFDYLHCIDKCVSSFLSSICYNAFVSDIYFLYLASQKVPQIMKKLK